MRSGGSGGPTDDPATRTNFSMTYNDDNIDNIDSSSEKPVDYSQLYQENGSVYEQPIAGLKPPANNGGSSAHSIILGIPSLGLKFVVYWLVLSLLTPEGLGVSESSIANK